MPNQFTTEVSVFDILPGLKAGDSYCAQGRRNAARESLRWVPAAGGMTASLTSQANRACPALNILIAPTTSAFSSKPQSSERRQAGRSVPRDFGRLFTLAKQELKVVQFIISFVGGGVRGLFSIEKRPLFFCYSMRLTPLGHNVHSREYHAWLSTITDTET